MRLKLLLLLLMHVASCFAQSDTLNYEVWEERHPGTLVGNLSRDTNLEKRWTSEQIQEMTFRPIVQQSSRFAEYFVVDESLGIIRTNRIIDRDRICSQSPTCDVSLTIRIDPIKYFAIIKVKITINDRNDNPPTFSSQQVDRSIQESASIGARISIPNAEDLDSEENGIKSYELQPDDTPFALDTSDFKNTDSLNLVLEERLDREMKDFYKLTVIAHDGGTTPLSGSMVIRITVLDSNDNNPSFKKQRYETTLYETAQISTTIISVEATDPDDGLNGDVIYSLEPATEAEFGHLFGIGNISGNIFLKQQLDYEDRTTYTLDVLARDRGPNSLPAYTRVIVNVQDVNDNAPVIQLNTLNENGIATVAEGASVGLFVAHLSVKDEDTTANEVNCTLDSIHFGLEQLFQTEYKIVTKTVFDREKQSEYHVNLVCQDSGNPPRTTTKYIPIIVADVNDNAPTFYQNVYNVTVTENSPVGTPIIRFNATDKDIGENAAILYKVRDEDSEWVNIDLVSGAVATSSIYDYETKSTISVVVTASDQGSPEQTTSATLVIHVLDVIDDTPQFQKELFSFSVEENVAPMTEVGLVQAQYNHDGVEYGIVYNLVTTKPVPFMVRNATIFTTASLDRENISSYDFQISANNIEDVNLMSTTNITISVMDINDNIPLVLYPNVSNNYMKISSETRENTVLLKINASDADEGINQELFFKISDSSCEKDLFGVDPQDGVMYLANPLNVSTDSLTCEVHVKVEDKGHPAKGTMVIMIFHVTNDVPFVPGPAYASTTEETTTNITGLASVKVHDDPPFWKTSTMFGVGVAIAVFVITLVILVAVAIVKHRRKAAADSRRYNCRLQAEKVLKTPPHETKESPVIGNEVHAGYGSHDTTMTLDIDIGESNTDDLSEWHGNVNPDIIRVTKGKGLSPKPSPNTSSTGSSRIQDSGLDISWQDTSGNPPIWTLSKDIPRVRAPSVGQRPKPNVASPLMDVELQVQDMLHMLEKDRGSDSGSFTDSGKGPSEEGDQHGHLPPLEPRYTAVKQASKSDIPLVAEAHQMALKVMDDYCRPGGSIFGKTPSQKDQIRDPRDPSRDPLREPFRFPQINLHPQNRGFVRRHHSDNIPVRSDKDHDNRRRSYTQDIHTRDPALYDIFDIPLQSSSPTSADNDSGHDDPYPTGWAKNKAPGKGRLPLCYLTSNSTEPSCTGSEYEMSTINGSVERGAYHPKHTSGMLLRSPKIDRYHPSSKMTQSPQIKSRPSYTVGPVDVCVKDVISQYIPKKANRREEDSCDALSDGTTTSGSYTVNSEVPAAKKESWGSDSIIV